MCLIFFGLQCHAEYPLVLVANRDEFLDRPAREAQFWPDAPDILGGQDLQAGGTWLAMHKDGRLAMITNYRDLRTLKATAPSRGHLLTGFLHEQMHPEAYFNKLLPESGQYNGYNLIAGNLQELWYHSNMGPKLARIEPGIHGLSNAWLDTPWPKVVKGKAAFAQITQGSFVPEDLFQMMQDTSVAPDAELPETGLPTDRERALSAAFIRTPGYGTRNTTVISVNRQNQVYFEERTYSTQNTRYSARVFTFQL